MWTVNDIITNLVSDEWDTVLIDHEWRPVEVALILDPVMPTLNYFQKSLIIDGLGELVDEVVDHTESDRRRVKTELREGIQYVELAWNGEPLSEETLRTINQGYQKGRYHRPRYGTRGGTIRAGYFLGQLGGGVTIENFSDEMYNVRNLVEIPVDDSD